MQGYLPDSTGAAVDGTQSLPFALYDVATGGQPFYSETQPVVVDRGTFVAAVGADGNLDLVEFRDRGDVWLGIQVGADPEMTPRLKLGSVPYAAFAQSSKQADTVPWTGISGVPSGLANGVSVGSGLTSTGGVIAVDPAVVQQRVSAACAPGSAIGSVLQDGTVDCVSTGSYTSGPGIVIQDSTLSVNTSTIQAGARRRLSARLVDPVGR